MAIHHCLSSVFQRILVLFIPHKIYQDLHIRFNDLPENNVTYSFLVSCIPKKQGPPFCKAPVMLLSFLMFYIGSRLSTGGIASLISAKL